MVTSNATLLQALPSLKILTYTGMFISILQLNLLAEIFLKNSNFS